MQSWLHISTLHQQRFLAGRTKGHRLPTLSSSSSASKQHSDSPPDTSSPQNSKFPRWIPRSFGPAAARLYDRRASQSHPGQTPARSWRGFAATSTSQNPTSRTCLGSHLRRRPVTRERSGSWAISQFQTRSSSPNRSASPSWAFRPQPPLWTHFPCGTGSSRSSS